MADYRSIICQRNTVNNPAPTLKTTAAVLASNAARSAFMIQNQDNANPLLICLGGTASASQYHAVLKSCSAAADGTGGTFAMESGVVFTGAITCYSAGTPSYTVLEI